ncbi:hypothetical protein D3C80_364640 [compost metagenome]
MKGEASAPSRRPRAISKGFRHPGPRAPGDVEARHGIAVPEGLAVAALRPSDHGGQADPVLFQPGPLLAGGERDIGAGPLDRPFVLGQRPVQTVPAGAAPPVAPGQIEVVAHAQLSLLRRVDQKQAAERPEGLAAEVGRVFLIHQGHALSSLHQLIGGDQTGQSSAHHDDVRVHIHPRLDR